ncbi:STM4015 family protein [Kitasatospora sp. NPDC058170]|uniref:STM4015 family protein n=1 Tax=Kitasatospora sp. NPDC058170 TaxID=3346364 RepID=UPI0036DB8FFC
MTVNHHIEQFHGLPVFDFSNDPKDPDHPRTPPAPGEAAWRLALEYESAEDFTALWSSFLATVDPAGVRALVIGPWWQNAYDALDNALDTVVRDAERLPALRALFIGDVTYDECEISWLEMCDVTSALESFPQLEELRVRGGSGLGLKPVRHDRLRALGFETGGLPSAVVRAVAGSELPALERLELWLGVDEYGGDSTIDDLAPLLDGARFPALRHLGLQNSEFQDEIAAAVAHAPVVAQLDTLDLSMGMLGDDGAVALIEGQPLTHLRALDLHHHYLTEELQQRLRESLPGVEVDLGHANHEDDPEDRYVAVAE